MYAENMKKAWMQMSIWKNPTKSKDVFLKFKANGTAVGLCYNYINKPNRQWPTFHKKQEDSEECDSYVLTLIITLDMYPINNPFYITSIRCSCSLSNTLKHVCFHVKM